MKSLCEDADLMKIDIGKLAKGIRGFEDLTPATQCWYGDYVPDVIVSATGFHLYQDRYDFGWPASGTYYGVFIDPKQATKIEEEFEELVQRLAMVTQPSGSVS